MKSITEIKTEFAQAGYEELPGLFAKYAEDPRAGVVSLIAQYGKRLQKLEAERRRLEGMRSYEHQYEALGLVCGVDEAGRGPLAGPVAAGAVILPRDCEILYLNDSKQLSETRREELYDEIREKAVAWGVGIVGPERIDEINILQATYEAIRQAVSALAVVPAVLLNDAVTIPGISVRQVPIVKGDAKSLSIAAASVMAKVTRDRMMREYDRAFPQYGFASHKGYGSAAHMAAIRKYGPSPIHRKSFLGNLLGTAEGGPCDSKADTAFLSGHRAPAPAGSVDRSVPEEHE